MEPLKRFLKYSAAGITAFVFDLLLLLYLIEILSFHYIGSAVFAFLLATSFNYYINSKWGYRKSTHKNLKSYVLFIFINSISLLIIVILMLLIVEILNLHYFLARIISGSLAGIFSFIMNSKVSFKMPILK